MRSSLHSFRLILVAALVLPLGGVLLISSTQAQIPRPQFPQPNINPPRPFVPNINPPRPFVPPPGINNPNPNIFGPNGMNPTIMNPPRNNFPDLRIPTIERVWTCTRCNGELGRGAFPPGQCPHCAARIVNGVGGAGNAGNPRPNNPPVGMNPPIAMNPPLNPQVQLPQFNPPAFNPPAFNPPQFNPPQVDFPQIQVQMPQVNQPVFNVPAPPIEQNQFFEVNGGGGTNGWYIAGIVFGGFLLIGIILGAIKASGGF